MVEYEAGPKFGYLLPEAKQDYLDCQKRRLFSLAEELFQNTGIKITLSGERHLGAVIGSQEYRDQYVHAKINKWIEDVEQLSQIAVDEPQLAYCAYTKALCMRWSFLQRTVPNSKHYFTPFEETIKEKLIPAIIGKKVSNLERDLISLPVRLGGLGIQNPLLTAEREFHNSTIITRSLTAMIKNQESDLSQYDAAEMTATVKRLKMEKEESMIAELETIKTLLNEKDRRSLELAGETGAGSWLTALPLESMGYILNKQEFRDAICFRYGSGFPIHHHSVVVEPRILSTIH